MNPHRPPCWPDAPESSAPQDCVVRYYHLPERRECWWIGPALILTGLIGLALIPILQ